MHRRLHLAAIGGLATLGLRVVCGENLDHVARFILHDVGGGDEEGSTQTHLLAGREAEVLRWGDLAEVVLFDPELAGEGHLANTVGFILGVVDHIEVFDDRGAVLVGGPVSDGELERLRDGHAALRSGVEFAAHVAFELFNRLAGVDLGDADFLAELADRGGRVAAATETTQGRHARVIPAVHDAVGDEFGEATLRRDGVGQFEACELDLAGSLVELELFEEPVVERTVRRELEGTQRVRHALDGVGLAVSPVVGGVDRPVHARLVMLDLADAVHQRITHLHVLVRHVDLGTERVGAVLEFTGAHAAEQIKVLFDAAIAERGVLARFGEGTAGGGDLLGALIVDVGEALLDQFLGPVVELLEVAGGVAKVSWLIAQPAHVFDDGFNEGVFLGFGVGVVHAQHATAAEVFGDAEIRDDCLGVPNVEEAIGFGWEPGLDTLAVAAVRVVFLDGFVEIVAGQFRHDRNHSQAGMVTAARRRWRR